MDWRTKLEDDIYEHMKCQLEDEEPSAYFIGTRALREAWWPYFHHHESHGFDALIYRLRWHFLDAPERESIIKIASILILMHWSQWESFESIFLTKSKPILDGSLPIPLQYLTRDDVLGARLGQQFDHWQSTFLPITIEEDQDQRYGMRHRFPFEFQSKKSSKGSYGAVTKVIIPCGYVKYRTASINTDKKVVLARKRLPDPDDWQKEVRNLRLLRQNVREHKNIMAHFGSVIMGLDFNILFEWADMNLHQLLYESDLREDQRPSDRLLAEAADLSSAVAFLHSLKPKCYHMDLKPENIVVVPKPGQSKPDEVGRWMITDFGISVFHAETTGSKTVAKRYSGAFQPPENDESWSKRTGGINEKGDVWALGGILSMVLAFAVGGPDTVNALLRARAYNSLGRQDQDFFYVLVQRGNVKEMNLKRSVQRWLMEVRTTQNIPWVTECVHLILWILRVEENKRPEAHVIETKLGDIIQLALGASLREGTGIPDLTSDTQNRLARRATEHLLTLTLTEDDDHREAPVMGKILGSPFNIFHRRKDSASQLEKLSTPTRNSRLSISSTPSSDHNSKHVAEQKTPSSDSTAGLKGRPGITHTLDMNRKSNRKVTTLNIGLCSSGKRIILCLNDTTILLERIQSRHSTQYERVDVLSACDNAYISGSYYALQGGKKENILLSCADTEADPSFAATIETDQDAHLVTSIIISSRGIAALLFQNSIRLLPARHLLTENRLGRSPYNYPIPSNLKQESFAAFAFTESGERLIAVGWKHWFVWDLNPINEHHVHNPTIGKLRLDRRYGETQPIIIPMNHRQAFLVYDAEAKNICLYDVRHRTTSQVPCKMLCGAILPHDGHLLYVQSTSSGPNGYRLMRRSFGVEVVNQEQHLVLGQERPTCDLNGLPYDKKAKLQMGFLQAELSCDLVVASSTGHVMEVHISYGD